MSGKKLTNYFKTIAIETSKLSTCRSIQVGAILVKDKRIIAIGYNGVASGKQHCNEIFTKENFDRQAHHEWSIYNEYHAEENVFAYCLRNGISTMGCEMYVTLSPCIHCARLIVNSGISKVFFIEKYDLSTRGIDFLTKNNLPFEQI